MPLTVKSKSESSFELLPPGTHVARCVSCVNLGLQKAGNWDPKQKVFVGFEVPSVRVEWDDKDKKHHEGPAFIGSRYTASLSKKAILRQQLESWRGRAFTEKQLDGFNLFDILDKPCLISVTHTDDGKYANINAIMGLPKGTEVSDRETPLMKYDESESTAVEDFANLHEWMQKAIAAGKDLAANEQGIPAAPAAVQPPMSGTDFDDDIPF